MEIDTLMMAHYVFFFNYGIIIDYEITIIIIARPYLILCLFLVVVGSYLSYLAYNFCVFSFFIFIMRRCCFQSELPKINKGISMKNRCIAVIKVPLFNMLPDDLN